MTSRIRANGIGIPDPLKRPTITFDHCGFCDADLAYLVDGNRYSRCIGVTDPFQDRVGWWRCPDCGAEVER